MGRRRESVQGVRQGRCEEPWRGLGEETLPVVRNKPSGKVVVLALALILHAASVASAEDSGVPEDRGTFYGFGNFGLYDPGGDIRSLHTGYTFSGGIGLRVHRNVAVDGTLALIRSDSASGDLWAIPLTVGARFIYPTPVFEPYLGLGYGVYYADLRTPGESDTSFTLVDYLSIGADAWVSRNVALNAELRYQSTNSWVIDPDVDTSGIIFTIGVRRMF